MKTIVKISHPSGYSILYTGNVLSSCAGYVAVKCDNFSDHGAHKAGAYYLSVPLFAELTGFEVM